MIRRLRGEVIDRTPSSAVVDVGGVGYQVSVPGHIGLHIGDEVDLHIHTHVREDALLLFGFRERIDLEVFELLITVPTIGPTKAMGILETPVVDIIGFVRDRDVKRLSQLPGVGKKTAERMVVDLLDKFETYVRRDGGSGPTLPAPIGDGGLTLDVISALVNLGFKPAVAEMAAGKSLDKLGASAAIEDLVREALAQVSRR